MTSYELTEWMAYERHAGPLGAQWANEAIASLHEQLQFLNYMTGQAHFTDKNDRKGPAPKPSHYPRPSEIASLGKAAEESEEEPLPPGGGPPPHDGGVDEQLNTRN